MPKAMKADRISGGINFGLQKKEGAKKYIY